MSKFDGLNAASRERFGRPVAELTPEELGSLHRNREIMPGGHPSGTGPRRPQLHAVPDLVDAFARAHRRGH